MSRLLYFIYSFLVTSFSIWIYIVHLKDQFYECQCDEYDAIATTYDYVVVGAGTGGATLALRLAEDTSVTVLLIEAGTEPTFALNIPAFGPLLQQSQYDWQYRTEPQEDACLGLKDQRSNWPMGRVVGGTSLMNNMMYVRGHRYDYDKWSAAGNPTWGYNEQARYFFKKAEFQRGIYKNDTLYHNLHGIWPVSNLRFVTRLSESVLNASIELGYQVSDLNGKNQSGFMQPQVNSFNGSRYSAHSLLAQHAFFKPNLRILQGAVVDKVLFKAHNEATGVRYRRFGGPRRRVYIRKAVVLAAGVIGSPKILMLSGVGPREHLNSLGIPVRKDLPVGQNLQDHVTTGLDLVILNQSLELSVSSLLNPMSAFKYYWTGRGPWVYPGCGAVGLVHSSMADPATDPPDLGLMAVAAGVATEGGVHIRHAMGISDEVWDGYFKPLIGLQTVTLLPVVLHPESRGEVKLRSRNVNDKPIINPRYLSSTRDVAILYEGIQLIKRLVATAPMQALGARINPRPLPGCEGPPFDSVAYWECYIRHLTMTAYHPVGTCKMGPEKDPTAVVNRYLRVHGTYRLRVVDASIMPTLPSGNTHAAVTMIAEKAADMLKRYWLRGNYVHTIAGACSWMEVFLRTEDYM